MNAIPHLCAAALLMISMPIAAAQGASQKSPPPEPATAKQPKGEPAHTGQKTTPARKEIDQAVDAIRTYSAERRAEALANAKRAADDLDRQLARLQQQTDQAWARMSQASRTRSQATMADLRKRRNALAEWVGGLRHSSVAAWGEVRAGFVKSYHELADAIRHARDELDKGNESSKDKDNDKDKAGKKQGGGKP
jgi:hypothetical protein